MSFMKKLSKTGTALLDTVELGAGMLNTGMLAGDNGMHILDNIARAGRTASEFWEKDISTGAAIQHEIRKVDQQAELQEHLDGIAAAVARAQQGPVQDVTTD